MSLFFRPCPARRAFTLLPLDASTVAAGPDRQRVQRILASLDSLAHRYEKAVRQLPDLGNPLNEPIFLAQSVLEYCLFVWPLCQQRLTALGLSPHVSKAVNYGLSRQALRQLGPQIRATPYADPDALLSARTALCNWVRAAPSLDHQIKYVRDIYSPLLVEAPLSYIDRARLEGLPRGDQPVPLAAQIHRTLYRRWAGDYLLRTAVGFVRDNAVEQFLGPRNPQLTYR